MLLTRDLQATWETVVFFKDIHIQNDENAFLVYLLNIYIYIFYKIKKWTKKLTSLQGFKKEKEKAIEQTGTTVLAFYIYVHDKFIHLNFFLKHTVQKKKKKSLTKKTP